MYKHLLVIGFLFHFLGLHSQNQYDFFKYKPSASEIQTIPNWAKIMYSVDPNVYDVIEEYSAYYLENEFLKSVHTQNYKYWVRKAYANIDKDGHIRIPESSKQRLEILANQKELKEQINKSNSTAWANIGPFETYFQNSTIPVSWQSNVYSMDQSISNPNLLICGTEHGGVFKTTNKGDTWQMASSNATFCNAVTAVAIDQSNNNLLYAASSGGVYKTVDGGSNWGLILFVNAEIHEIKFDPNNSNHIFIVSNSGLDESIDGGSNWNKVFTDKSFDLDYHPSNTNYVYLLKENSSLKKVEFYRSINNGGTWSLMSNGWYVPESINEANVGGGKIGVSPQDPNRVYAALIGESKSGDNGWIGVYRSDNAGANWYLPAGQIGSPYTGNCGSTGIWNVAAYCGSSYHQGFYNFDFEVSSTNANLFWIGTIRLTESNDGGTTFTSIGGSGSARLANIHADIQSIHVQGNDIWVSSDGGINYSNDDLQTHSSKKYGISASSFWGFDIGWNEDVVVGGRYHNGNAVLYDNYGFGNSHQIGGVEEPAGHVHTMDNEHVYFGYYYANTDGSSNSTSHLLVPPTLGSPATNFSNINFRNNEFYIPYMTSEFTHHPNYADHIVAGRLAAIWQSKDGGQTWNVLHDFVDGYVTEIEYCRSDPNHLYCINRATSNESNSCELYKSLDGGNSWNLLTTPPTNDPFRFTIATNPLNENEIWAAAPYGANGSKIYKSINAGQSWINMTTATLDGAQIFDMEFHGGSSGTVYILTKDKYFYLDELSNNWVQYNIGLPFNLSDNEIKFTKLFYRDSKIRLGCSRGVWEASFPVSHAPVAEPMSYTDSIFCEEAFVQLESYSMIDQTGATWAWNISPTPQYISSPNIRNPQVVFGATGNYDVSLTVTNANGQSHTKTVQNMFKVSSDCQCSPCQDCSGTFYTNGDAAIDSETCCIDLAENTTWSVGSFWQDQRINLNQSFIMNFDIDLGDISSDNDVDGVAFVLQNQSYYALGNSGSELGRNGISNSIAVAFRTYVHDRIEIWANGESYGNDLSGNPYPISGNGSHAVKIEWNAQTNTLFIDWNNDGNDIVFNEDIITNYFGGNPNNIIWGFTGATGGLAGTNRICNIELFVDDCPFSYTTFSSNNLTGYQFTNTHFETNTAIQSNEVIDLNAIIKYDAGMEIFLEPGFEVKLGVLFDAYIDGCGGN